MAGQKPGRVQCFSELQQKGPGGTGEDVYEAHSNLNGPKQGGQEKLTRKFLKSGKSARRRKGEKDGNGFKGGAISTNGLEIHAKIWCVKEEKRNLKNSKVQSICGRGRGKQENPRNINTEKRI